MVYFILIIYLFLNFAPLHAALRMVNVTATYMTPIPEFKRDYMDDPAICIHPSDPNKSLIIGTNKSREEGGLFIYNLKGKELARITGEAMNNVDVRYAFPLIDEKVDIVVASKPHSRSLGIYKLDFDSHTLTDIAAPNIDLKVDSYGTCLYKSPKTNKFYVLITTKRGYFHQYELLPTVQGKITTKHVRSVNVGSKTEGIVADDANATLFVSEEDVGLWKYHAEPDSSNARQSIGKVGNELTQDVEGVSIIQTGHKSGYVIVSSQGSSSYFVYNRQKPYELKGGFKVVNGGKIEGSEETDGLDVCNLDLGPNFRKGLLVVHDNRTSKGGGSNFKLISWDKIAQKLNLTTNNKWNPRKGN